MRKHLEHAAPFVAYFIATFTGAVCHHFITPLVILGTRYSISGRGLLPAGLTFVRPLGALLYALPVFVGAAWFFSYRFPTLRTAEFMANIGCAFILLYLCFAIFLAYPLVETGLLNR